MHKKKNVSRTPHGICKLISAGLRRLGIIRLHSTLNALIIISRIQSDHGNPVLRRQIKLYAAGVRINTCHAYNIRIPGKFLI